MLETTESVQANRIGELDLLRFCAASLVVMYHYGFRGFAADGMTTMPFPYFGPFAKYGYLPTETWGNHF